MIQERKSGDMQIKLAENILKSLLFITIFISLYIYGFTVRSNGDNVEHLHMSWLIWQGKIPYKDFFQHHNPLVWYMSSPLVAALINNIKIFSIFNVISIITLCLTVFYQSKILKLCNVENVFQILFSVIVLSSFSVLYSSDYRPDTFMYMFFFAGIYYLLKYTLSQTLKDLVVSFVCLFFSFACSQKIIFNLLLVGCLILYCLYKKKISKENFLLSIMLPVLVFITYLVYLYSHDSFLIYLKIFHLII